MTEQELLAMGLDAETAKKVIDNYKKSIDGNFIPKTRFDEVNEQLKTQKAETATLTTQIEDLKKFEGTAEELQQKIAEAQTQIETEKAEHQKEMDRVTKTNLAKEQILKEKKVPHVMDDVLGALDFDKLSVDNGNLIGLTEQLKGITESKPHWFKETAPEDKKPPFKFFGTEPPISTENNEDPLNKLSPEQQFGKMLASSVVGPESSAKTAMDYYFGK